MEPVEAPGSGTGWAETVTSTAFSSSGPAGPSLARALGVDGAGSVAGSDGRQRLRVLEPFTMNYEGLFSLTVGPL